MGFNSIFWHWGFHNLLGDSTLSCAKVHFSRQDTMVMRLVLLQKKNYIYNSEARETKFGLFVNFISNERTISIFSFEMQIFQIRDPKAIMFPFPQKMKLKVHLGSYFLATNLMTVKRIAPMRVSTKHRLIIFFLFFLFVFKPEKSSDLMQEHSR